MRKEFPYKFKKKALERDNYECQFKGEGCLKNKRLQFHHLDYNNSNITYKNIVVVCYYCHRYIIHRAIKTFKCKKCKKDIKYQRNYCDKCLIKYFPQYKNKLKSRD